MPHSVLCKPSTDLSDRFQVVFSYLLQGVDDDEANIGVSMDETDDLFFQSLPNSVAFCLQNETFRVFFCIDKLVKALLQTTQCIFQREIQHGSRFYFHAPTRISLAKSVSRAKVSASFCPPCWGRQRLPDLLGANRE